jgi:hypothetical protein
MESTYFISGDFIASDNFDEPGINSGPCGPFANAFLKL